MPLSLLRSEAPLGRKTMLRGMDLDPRPPWGGDFPPSKSSPENAIGSAATREYASPFPAV